MLATLHGWTNTRTFSRLWLYECLDRWALRRIDTVVVVARQMLALRALRGIAASRQRVIENGIPPLGVRINDLTMRGAPPLPTTLVDFTTRSPTLIAIGRLSPEKGFTLLLDAFARARTQIKAQYQLLIVGEGSDRNVLCDRIAALGLTNVARLGGYVDGADRLLERAAGFVMSSVTEGMPLVLLEAMQWRAPILATSVGAIPELLDYGARGRLVPPNNLAALTHAMQTMMEEGLHSNDASVAAAATAVSERYTSARMADDYFSVYGAIA
jgi:glycosyltransferase involved in cell wall biosynthesis